MRGHMMEGAVQSFAERPALYIHPNRSRDWLPLIPPAVTAELLRNKRLVWRISALISAYYGLSPVNSADRGDFAIALLDITGLSQLVQLSGAIYYGQYLRTEISGAVIAGLFSGLGVWAHDAAVSDADLGLQLESEVRRSVLLTREAMMSDGYHCFWAWTETLPPPVSQRVWLKFADGPPPGELQPLFRKLGPDIVRAAARSIILHAAQPHGGE